MPIEEKDDEEKKPKPQEDEEEGKEVSTEPDEKEDDDGEAGESAESRAEKKRNRYREAKEQASAAQKRADEVERELQAERAARVAAQTAAQMLQQTRQEPQQDPWAEPEKYVKDKFQFILSETQRLRNENRLDEEAAKRLQTEWIENQQRQQELVTRKLMWQQHAWNQSQQPMVEQQQRLAAVEARLNAEFPEVMNHPQARNHASAGWQMAIAAGKPNSWETAKEVMATTMRAFRLGRPPSIDDVTRRRYSGVGGGSNGANGTKATFKMTKAHEKMAEGRFPNLTPELAHKKWAQTIGKKILEEES